MTDDESRVESLEEKLEREKQEQDKKKAELTKKIENLNSDPMEAEFYRKQEEIVEPVTDEDWEQPEEEAVDEPTLDLSKEQKQPVVSSVDKLMSKEELFNLQKRLNQIKAGSFTYEGEKGKPHIKVEEYILTFKETFDVKTLRTQSQTDKPPMYLYGEGYYIQGVEAYFTETNHQLFGTRMTKHMNTEFRQKLQAWSYVDADYFETFDPDYLNVQNGILNLRTKEFLSHDPKYRMTTILPVKYEPDVEYGFFEDFVKQIVDKEDTQVIQEMFGDCLYRSYWLQKCFLLFGGGANGKGVLLHCLTEMLGEKNCSSVNLVDINEDKFKIAELHRKRANISNETPNRSLTTTDKFKSLRGGDRISAERKYAHPFQFVNHAKMIFATNKIPSTPDYTYAFWRSWILVKFPHKFEGDNCNKNLKKELTTPENLSGILNYAIEGLQRLFVKKDFSYSKTADEVEEQWKKEANTPLAFVLGLIKEDKESKVLPVDLWNRYLKFCTDGKITAEGDKLFWRRWNKYMKKYFPNAEHKQFTSADGQLQGKWHWKGIKIIM